MSVSTQVAQRERVRPSPGIVSRMSMDMLINHALRARRTIASDSRHQQRPEMMRWARLTASISWRRIMSRSPRVAPSLVSQPGARVHGWLIHQSRRGATRVWGFHNPSGPRAMALDPQISTTAIISTPALEPQIATSNVFCACCCLLHLMSSSVASARVSCGPCRWATCPGSDRVLESLRGQGPHHLRRGLRRHLHLPPEHHLGARLPRRLVLELQRQ